MLIRRFTFGLIAVGLTACTERITQGELAPPTNTAQDAIGAPAGPAATDTSELVALPNGLYHRSCVREVPNNGRIESNGTVTTVDGRVIHYAPCLHPGPVARTDIAVARSPWKVGPNSWARPASVTPPTTGGWIESATTNILGSGNVFRQISADWTAPPKPYSYTSGNIVYLFPALLNNFTAGGSSTANTTILQPVLQLGNSGIKSPGNNWIGALFICRGATDPCYVSSSALSVTAGDFLSGGAHASNCSSGKCDWTVDMTNNTTLVTMSMTLAAGTPTDGQTNDTYILAASGALETYNLNTCDEFPAGPISFTSVALYTQAGIVSSPSWGANTGGGVTPQCGYGVTPTSTSATLALTETTALRAVIGGPSSIMDATSGTWSASVTSPHVGTPPYMYSWSGILSGSSSSVSGVPSGSGYLFLRVTDANSVNYDTSLYVTVCAPGLLIC